MPDDGSMVLDDRMVGGTAPEAKAKDPTAEAKAKDLVKVSMNFSSQTIAILRDLSRRSGATMTEVTRRSIGLQQFVTQEIEAGGKLLVEDKKGNIKRVLLP